MNLKKVGTVFLSFILLIPFNSLAATQTPSSSTTPTTANTTSATANTTSSSTSQTADSSSSTKNSTTTTKAAKTRAISAETSSSVASSGVGSNIQSTSVQVEPFTGSANLSVPIQVPPGRGGIQPTLALSYSSTNRQLGLAGVGWSLDLGAIQRSTKKGLPSYNDNTDIFTLFQGASQDLVADPNTSGLYHPEVEGSFAKIEHITNYWMITDRKGTKYYFGGTDDSRQYDTTNTSHIFRWALNRVEDINGNYMTITYLKDQGQLYPQTIAYTGNSLQSLNPYAKVVLSYVATSQKTSSYMAGFNITTAQRIDHLTMSVNSNVQTVYALTYKQSLNTKRDLLQSVQQFGSDSTTFLPPITFAYTGQDTPLYQLSSTWQLPTTAALNMLYQGLLMDSGVRIVDLNGDNYPDIIRSFWGQGPTCPTCVPSSVKYNFTYLNNNSNGWYSVNAWTNSVPFSRYGGFYNVAANWTESSGTRLADFNGDGLIDFAHNMASPYDPWNSFYINDLATSSFISDSSWSLPIFFLSESSTPSITSTGVLIGDINGDGFPDIVESHGGSSSNGYLNQYPQGIKNFRLNLLYSTPVSDYTNFNLGTDILVDLNGDGLADIVYLKGGVCKVFLRSGSNWQETGDYENTFGLGDLTNSTTQFIDVNGDGLPDIVMANGTDSGSHVLINTGNAWVQDDRWIPHGANFTDFSSQFLDANADGMQGYLIYPYNQSPQMYVNTSKPADLLNHIDNGVGGISDIIYDSSAHYSNTFLPFIQQVVKSITVSDAFSHSYTTHYSYANGNWDVSYREFQGFGNVTITDAQGNYTTTTFWQDHWLKGRPSEQTSFDAQGKRYAKSVNRWQAQNLWSNSSTNQTSKFVYVSRTDNYLYDGTTTLKRTASEITYGENPQYGDPTQTINYGEVDVAGNDIGTDMLTSTISYVNNPTSWLLGLPSQTMVMDINGTLVSKTSFYYDGSTSLTATPSLGRLTAKTNWLGSSTQADPQTKYTYDVYGNLLTTVDPIGNTTTITYDNDVHMFPVQMTNALNQTSKTSYYGVDGTPLNASGLRGLWGQTRSVTDANTQTAYTSYDVLGRPSFSVSPLDSVALPTSIITYNIQPTYTAVISQARVESGSSPMISSVTFYDGLGRVIESKSLGPNAGQSIVSGQTEYDQRGLPIKKYVPRFTTTSLSTLDPIDSSVAYAQMQYDAMGRAVKSINPDGTYSNVVYDHWDTTTFDENGHMQKSYKDAMGRLIKKEEYKGADGRWASYPSNSYTVYATTNYTYDALGNLTKLTDTKNNVTTISYDHLNRKIAMNDPDMGAWSYNYDANGNLISQVDAKGQTVRFSYDALNRLLNKTDGIPSGPINNFPILPPVTPSFNVVYNYDPVAQNYAKGRLGSVTYDNGQAGLPAGQAGFTYDQVGREIASTKTIDGTTYNVSRQYDALNRLKQIQYPDGAQVKYLYNQAGQVTAVADAAAVVNGTLVLNDSPIRFAANSSEWFDKALGVKDAYAAVAKATPAVTKTAPSVTLTSPDGGSYVTPTNIVLTASASTASGSITKVVFYRGTTLLATVTSAPYTYTWSNAAPGVYSLTAKATNSGGVTQTSTAVNVTVTQPPPTVSISSPSNNAYYLSPATITLSANATASYGTISKVEFYNGSKLLGNATKSPYTYTWKNVAVGNYTLTAKVYNNGLVATSSAVSINVTKTRVPPTVSLATTDNTYSYMAPVNIGLTANASAYGSTINKVDFYNGTTLLGTSTNAPYNFVWGNAALGNYSLTAVVTDSFGATGRSAAVNITVNQPLPTVSLTSPSNNTTSTAPGSVVLSANATTSYGTIDKVEFYNGTTLLATATSSPYTYTWSNVIAGNYSLSAKAYNNGLTAISSAINVIVNPHIAPTINITAPTANTSYMAPATIPIIASASANNASISKVDFYNGTSLIGTSTSAPYSISWNNVIPGNYNLTAVVTDSTGATGASTAINVIVNQPAPVVNLTSPINNTGLIAPTDVVLTANASSSFGTISKVEFYADTELIATVTSAPYTYVWSNALIRSYDLTAKAYDNLGQVTTSGKVNISLSKYSSSLTADKASYTSPGIAIRSTHGCSKQGRPVIKLHLADRRIRR
ncbi:MAG: hypothetical protein HQL15_08325 [Candidatus Omnitrophica bacterium]|nr:hypothetical protein [Candidatus Omnitrophota bacterium]